MNSTKATLGGWLGVLGLLLILHRACSLAVAGTSSNQAPAASLGDDGSLLLVQVQGSPAAADAEFQVVAPDPGVYPIRIVYTAGAGAGGPEFSQWVADPAGGQKQVLVNDTVDGAVAAFAGLLPNAFCDCDIGDPFPMFTALTVISNQMTIAWTGSARLQQGSSVLVPGATKWTTVSPAPTGHSYTTTTTNGSLFFRMIFP